MKLDEILKGDMFLVVPKDTSNESIQNNLIDIKHLGNSEDDAWDKFLYPCLNKEGYVKDGFKAVKVTVKVFK